MYFGRVQLSTALMDRTDTSIPWSVYIEPIMSASAEERMGIELDHRAAAVISDSMRDNSFFTCSRLLLPVHMVYLPVHTLA